MRKSCALALAATLVGGLMLFTGGWAMGANEAQNARAEQKSAELHLPNGFQQKDLNQIDNIRGELATVTQEAVTRGDFGKLIKNLAVVDRDRMKDYSNQDFKVLDGVVGQINQDWKQKYGHEFDLKRATNVFTDRQMIVRGVVTDANVAAANFPAPAEAGEQAHLAASKEKGHEQGQAEQVERKDLQKSKGVALTRFPAEGSLPEITASMIEEGHGKWRIAVPASLTSQQVHTQLQNHLTYFGRDVKQWPDNEEMAYRQVAHHVLMALYDINAPQAQQAK